MQPDQFKQLASQIGGSESASNKIEALNALLLSQVSDIVGCESWSTLKVGYRKCLVDPDQKVSKLALKFHSRLITSGSHFAIKEGFLNLIVSITSWYKDKKIHSMLPSHGLSAETYIHGAYLNILNLMVLAAKDITKIWIRFPQKYVEEIIESMVELLTMSGQ